MLLQKDLKHKSLLILKEKWPDSVITTLLFFILIIIEIFTISAILAILFKASTMAFSAFWISINKGELTGDILNTILIVAYIIYIISLLFYFLISPLLLGITMYFLSLSKGENPKIPIIFNGYKKAFWNSIFSNALIMIYVTLWSLLLIVPGIVKAFAYSMTYFIIAENPNISSNEAIRKSQELMKGHKWEYFKLQLSFMGWRVLNAFTLSVGSFWLVPYIQTTLSNYYIQLKEDYEEKNMENSVTLEQF